MAENTNTEREALRSIGEEQAFEAWFKMDCPVDGINAKLAAKAAWQARASLSLPAAGQEPVALEPERSAWINPCDKSQGQYLPHIGEPVLFKHEGRVYTGKHTGGSFKSDFPLGKHFDTWNCVWAYPSALDSAAPQPAVAAGWELPALTPELAKILGTMCFQCITFAQALRQAGHQINNRAEDEQAATLHWMLGHYFRHGEDGWRQAAMDDMERMRAAALPPAPSTEGESNG